MTLKEFKEENNLTIDDIAAATGINRTIVHRAVTNRDYCWKLFNAHKVFVYTNGQVSYEDMLAEECV